MTDLITWPALLVLAALVGAVAVAAARRGRAQGHAAGVAAGAARTAELSGRLAATEQELRGARDELTWQREHNGALEARLAPVQESMRSLQEHLQLAETRRTRSEAELGEKVSTLAREFTAATHDVRAEARRLSTVLSRTERRGAWGEMQLRSLVEAAGMVRHIQFVEQDHTHTDDGTRRPDLVVRLAGGRRVVVDAKVPLDAFLRLSATPDAGDRPVEPDAETLAEHGRLVHQHLRALSAKEYWRRYDSVEFVVLFLPSEALLSAALDARPELLQEGLDHKVLLATPTTLLAMLHTISHSWREVEAAEQAREIHRTGMELYERLLTAAAHLDRLGGALTRTVTEYNALIGSWETRALVSARRLAQLGGHLADLPEPAGIEDETRTRRASAWPATDTALAAPDNDSLTDPQAPQPPRQRADPGAA